MGLSLGIGAACTSEPSSPIPSWPVFVDIALESGVDGIVRAGGSDKTDILEANTGGVAILDYDGDGDRDLFLVNGGPGASDGGPGADDAGSSAGEVGQGAAVQGTTAMLYRNDGDGHFTDVSAEAGVAVAGWGMGVAVWDVDGDQWPDIYLTAWGPNTLLRNRGDGTFESLPLAGGAQDHRWSTGIAAADYDLDGDVDLYLAQYVDRPQDSVLADEPLCSWRGIAAFCGPAGMRAAPDRLFEYTQGDPPPGGRSLDDPSRDDPAPDDRRQLFADVSLAAGLEDHVPAFGLGAVAGDLDEDGDADLYVANDATPNFLYRNQRSERQRSEVVGWPGLLQQMGDEAGVAVSADGRRQAGMGISIGDIDADGRTDLLVSNFSHDHVSLYRQQEEALLFRETAFDSDLGRQTLATLGWGTGLVDFDHDADLDLFLANGHVYPQVDAAGIGTTYRQRNQIFRNELGYLRDVSKFSGPALQVEAVSRGAAFGDLDEDGDVDAVIVNLDDVPSLLRNEGVEAGGLTVTLVGTGLNTSAIGARVVVSLPDGKQMTREVRAGTGYLSQDDHRLHFGTGDAKRVRVTVFWPGGGRWSGEADVRQHLKIAAATTLGSAEP
ncbi:MAG: CRTAC1 family protein [Gemmatimonadetes bacterium]|nr:CRTAC1 family protein [Gemmatimonadota bacterium]